MISGDGWELLFNAYKDGGLFDTTHNTVVQLEEAISSLVIQNPANLEFTLTWWRKVSTVVRYPNYYWSESSQRLFSRASTESGIGVVDVHKHQPFVSGQRPALRPMRGTSVLGAKPPVEHLIT